MNYIPADTTLEAHRKQVEILRKLSPQRKALMAMELTDNIRQIAIEGIRSRHPEFNEKQVMRELLRLIIGDDIFQKIAAAKGFK
jgi:hypothetical protein